MMAGTADPKTLTTGGAWMALAIDRFPLAFAMRKDDDTTTVAGVSKYAHLRPYDGDDGSLLAALLTTTPAILSMERLLKEGTRKTLRKNENGYAKEVTRGALGSIRLPDWTQWDPATLAQIKSLAEARSERNLSRLDDAVSDGAWMALDNAVLVAMGIRREDAERMRNLALALYWRRMRNTLKYGDAERRAMGKPLPGDP